MDNLTVIDSNQGSNGDKSPRKDKNSLFPNLKVFLSTITICLSSFTMGAVCAFPSPALVKMDTEVNGFHLTLDQKSWVVSTAYLGGFLGGLIQRPFADGLGRKLSLMLALIPLSVGWTVVICAHNYWMLYIGRILTGLTSGLNLGCAPVYVAEISPTNHRGFLLSIFTFLLSFGILWTYVIGEFCSWRWLVVSYMCFNVVMVSGMAFIPESPRWLALTNRKEAAIESLKWFRGHDDVIEEFNEIQENIKESNGQAAFRLSEIGKREIYLPLVITLGLTTVQIWTGIGVFDSYTVTIFQLARTQVDPFLATTIIGLVEFVGNCTIIVLIRQINRRHLLIASGFGMTLSLAGLATFYKLLSVAPTFAIRWLYWLPITAMVVYFVTYDMGWNALPTMMMGELLPLRIRGFASGLNSAWSFISIYLTTHLFPFIVRSGGEFSPFLIYACFALAGIFFAIYVVRETKNKTLEEIEKSFRQENHKS